MKLKLAWDGQYSCRLHIKICGSKSCSILFSYLAFPHVQVVQMILTAYPGAKSDDKFNYFWMGLEWVNQFSYQPETPYGFSCELNHCCLGVEKFPLILHLIFFQIELLMKFKFRYRLRKSYDSSEFFAKPLRAIFCLAKFSILDIISMKLFILNFHAISPSWIRWQTTDSYLFNVRRFTCGIILPAFDLLLHHCIHHFMMDSPL